MDQSKIIPGQLKFWAHQTAEVAGEAIIGQGTKIWQNSQVLGGAEIGENCTIGHNCFIGGRAKIGNGVKLESNVDVWDLVTLEDYVFVGPSAVFTNDPNPRAKYPKKQYPEYGQWRPTLVRMGASIGANATIICGVTIGKNAFIGAGAVVTKDVPGHALMVGIPSRVIGWMCECGNKLDFKKTNQTVCYICKKKYGKVDDNIRCISDL
jgi:UDP-2-acetamido-3-amino-2,3-dideoxy-glucuronate N-acetyltransferase